MKRLFKFLNLESLKEKIRAMNKQIFKEIQTLKRQILPNEKVILFDSQARGDAREDLDWDLLVLLNKKGKVTFEEDTTYGYPSAC